MRYALILLCVSGVFLLQGCSESEDNSSYKPSYTGKQGELVVVAPKPVWNSDEANYLRAGLLALFPGLPAEEPLFSPVEVMKEGFDGVFKTHRNLLEIRIDPTNELNVVKRKNVFAKNQLQITVTFNNTGEFEAFSENTLPNILMEFHRAEINRLVSRNAAFGSKELNQEVEELTGLSIVLQEDISIAKSEHDFIWLRLDREKPVGGYQHQINQGIMVYSRPYTDTIQFNDSNLLQWKSAVNQQYIPGPNGSFMSISDRYLLPQINTINFNGSMAKEIRGLWRMDGVKGVHMGGPFYSLVFYDESSQKQYLVEGYVYGPQFNKRAFVREIEAMVKSVKPSGDS